MTSASAERPVASVSSVRAQTDLVRWGDAGTEKGELEAPRGHDQITDGDDGQALRWGDSGTEKGELEAPRA
jgi:hypothetical protein